MAIATNQPAVTSVESDASLVAATIAGNHSAYGQLYDRYAPLVRALCFDTAQNLSQSQDLFQLVNPTRYPGCEFYVGINIDPADQATVGQCLRVGPEVVDHARDFESRVTRLREFDSSQIVRKGEEIVGGQKMIRFEEPSEAFDPSMINGVVSIWVNEATSLPVRFYSDNCKPLNPRDKVASFELRDLQFDLPLKDELFEFPKFAREKVAQNTDIVLAHGMSLEKVTLKISSADGHVLATSDDLDHVSVLDLGANRHVPARILTEAARKRIDTTCQAGQKLRVQLDGQDTQPMEIFGTLRYLKLVPPLPPYETALVKPKSDTAK